MTGARGREVDVQRSTTGLGPVLRKARLARGVTLEEASRDTRIRAEFLDALEEEDFDRLLGDVHVRGCLRSYATYLGLPADRVMERYGRHAEEPMPAPQAAPPARDPSVGVKRRRDNHRFVILAAVTVLVLAAAFGVLSAREPAPAPADLVSGSPAVGLAPTTGIEVSVLARQPVDVTIRIDDGAAETFSLEAGEGRSWAADTLLAIRLSHGASARVTVNGRDLGYPGQPDKAWQDTYSFGDESPSAAP